jgi:hypothetical protein
MEPEKESEPVKVYSSYTEAQKRATKKYREQNKEKVNAQRKKYYDERKEKDPNFLQYKREKAKEYYIRKKGVKEEEPEDKTDEEEIEVVDVITDKTEPEVDNGEEDLTHLIPQIQEAIKILETPEEKKKPERKPRQKKGQKENIKPEDLEDLKKILIEKVVEEVTPTTPEPEQVVKVPKTPRPKKNKKAV